jgi:predicted acyltransferase
MAVQSPTQTVSKERVASEAAQPKRPPGTRLVSLDAFRGLTIGGMLLVNNVALDGRTPTQLMHAPWNGGIRFADLIFPWFLLIVGVALPFSAAGARKRNLGGGRYALRVLGRVCALVFLGCLIDSSLLKQPVFDLNVLQLIGLAYGVGALLSVLPVWLRVPAAFALLAAHTAVIQHLSVPGLGRGVFREDANAIWYLNRAYLNHQHLTGLVSVVPTAALVLLGTVMGDALRRERWKPWEKIVVLLAFSGILLVCGWAWHFSLPYNKPVWTASYILWTAGLGGIVLTLLYALVDASGRKWTQWLAFPLVVYGSNAIAAYVGPILIKVFILRVWTWKMPDGTRETLEQAFLHTATAHYGPVGGGWVYTLGYLLVVWLALLELRRRKLFLRV